MHLVRAYLHTIEMTLSLTFELLLLKDTCCSYISEFEVSSMMGIFQTRISFYGSITAFR